ncbi:penicillin-binding transpeptidase domain-containing protein [Streptomyces corynorhini]|uniref:Penicillin-binding protein n=1 Tax=Streptomyces corynorhini TaxID=2282652 RepID=A0A370B1L1_9ACTN|nr:penicillin-binding transpeptidase domain-containing protein [Streptomyces corynorhini]RDG33954.1 penicillin-binding protein [Streptomyces corynorhini]
MRSGAKTAVIGGVFLVVAGGVGYGAYATYGNLTGGSGSVSAKHEVKTGPLSAEEIDQAAKDFLAGWAKGDDGATLAQLTNDAAAAASVIDGYRDQAHVTDAVITPGVAVGTKVPFEVKATVEFGGKSAPWSYSSELTVVRGQSTGRPLVAWAPSVIHPKLTKTNQLVTGEASAPQIEAVDRNGVELTKEKYPSLGPILNELRERYGEKAGGSSGIELALRGDGEGASNPAAETLLTLSKGTPGKLTTTLDANVQAAAERSVKQFSEASVAAVQPSTGEILAIANNRSDGFNAAMLGKQAPGSTMKIVTAAMLMEKGLAAADKPTECPPTAMYMGRTFQNLDKFSLDNRPFSESFARSCNTAFIKLIDDVNDDSALKTETEEVFGIGLDNWKAGIPTSDGSVPAAQGGEAAAQYIGQGTVQMNVLNMASITATVKNGGFKQPVIVPAFLDDREIATAARPLPPGVAQQLRRMMAITATSGTGAKAMSGLGGDKGAKTGSAEVDGQETSNSWFAGYRDDLAAAAVVQAGGHGGDAAGPVVAAVLGAG